MLDRAEQVEAWLQAVELAEGQGADVSGEDRVARTLAVAALMAQTNPRVGATALAVASAIGHEVCRSREEELCMALEASARADRERALALLAELATWPNTGALGAKARELSMRLRAEGCTLDRCRPRSSPTAW